MISPHFKITTQQITKFWKKLLAQHSPEFINQAIEREQEVKILLSWKNRIDNDQRISYYRATIAGSWMVGIFFSSKNYYFVRPCSNRINLESLWDKNFYSLQEAQKEVDLALRQLGYTLL